VTLKITNIKLCIEFDGVYWHTDKNKKRDERKQKFLEILNFQVIRINELDFYKDSEKIIKYCLNKIKEREFSFPPL